MVTRIEAEERNYQENVLNWNHITTVQNKQLVSQNP